MKIREIVEADRVDFVRLRDALWPGADHDAETREYFGKPPNTRPLVFVAEAEGRLVGFLELDYRKSAPGCSSSPVPFIEGWYVEPGCKDVVSGEPSLKLPTQVRAPKDIVELLATQRLRTWTVSPSMLRWGMRKSSG